ncbi:MAG: hypothetical protein LC798_13720 [Chloroflexi bacterium]|nr:hypothetical protein [Chloroflexota bacterium]
MMVPRPLLYVAALTLLVGSYLVVWYASRWFDDDFNRAQPPEVLSGSSVKDAVEREAPVSGVGLVTEGRAPVVRRGRTDPLPLDSPERRAQRRHAADVLDAQAIPLPSGLADSLPPADAPGLMPPVRVMRDGDSGAISVMDSRGAWQREEQRCPEGRRWEAGTTLDGIGFYGNCERSVPALLPAFARTAAICTAVAGGGYLIAAGADYDHPEYVAGAAGAGCVLIRVAG